MYFKKKRKIIINVRLVLPEGKHFFLYLDASMFLSNISKNFSMDHGQLTADDRLVILVLMQNVKPF